VTARDPEAEYYQGVEEFFVSRRGDPLFLSNADWLLIRDWRKQGLPLRIVLRGIADALESHAHSWSRGRKVGSLRYCEAEVEVARERWERALAVGSEPGVDVGATLAGFAEALAGALGLGQAAQLVATRVAEALRQLAVAPGPPRDIEPRLAALEGELVAALRAEGSPDQERELGQRVDSVLAPYRAKLPARVYADLRTQSVIRERLAAHGLARLSLFGL
jgi:hypothetical protein